MQLLFVIRMFACFAFAFHVIGMWRLHFFDAINSLSHTHSKKIRFNYISEDICMVFVNRLLLMLPYTHRQMERTKYTLKFAHRLHAMCTIWHRHSVPAATWHNRSITRWLFFSLSLSRSAHLWPCQVENWCQQIAMVGLFAFTEFHIENEEAQKNQQQQRGRDFGSKHGRQCAMRW